MNKYCTCDAQKCFFFNSAFRSFNRPILFLLWNISLMSLARPWARSAGSTMICRYPQWLGDAGGDFHHCPQEPPVCWSVSTMEMLHRALFSPGVFTEKSNVNSIRGLGNNYY